MFTALDSVCESGITIASDGAEYKKIREFDPVDATTNPSLVLAAVCKTEYSFLLDDALHYAQWRLPDSSIEEQTQLTLDYLLVQVGAQILNIIPGRVSISVDPRLGYDYDAIMAKSYALVAIVKELDIPQSRILIKIPATVPGIRAAHQLEAQNIHTNLTLVFSLVQALACAQAGVAVISPFIGRVKDWWSARAIQNGIPEGLMNQPLSEHPGIELVHRIRAAYTKYGHKTQIMAAGFRKVEEVIELSKAGSKGGPDLMTLPPDLLDGLRQLEGQRNSAAGFIAPVETRPEPFYFSTNGPTKEGDAAFERDSAQEMISLDKVPEGLAKFSRDANTLEDKVREKLHLTSPASTLGFRASLGRR